MADFLSTGAVASDKSYLRTAYTDLPPAIVGGLVQHPLVSPTVQYLVLKTVDETGGAPVEDIVAVLAGHSDPVGAVAVMIGAGLLAREGDGVIDANTIIHRSDGSGPEDSSAPVTPRTSDGGPLPDGFSSVPVSTLHPSILVADGANRRSCARCEVLRRPGFYVLLSGELAYVGMGSELGLRVASGNQPISDVDSIICITDAGDGLTVDDARVLERIFHARVAATGEVRLVNGTPDGAPISPSRFRELNVFAGRVCDALSRAGLLFVRQSPRMVLAGPRAEAGMVEPQRPLNSLPGGEVMELSFGQNLTALAARRGPDDWLLLRGSDIRLDTVPSAAASASVLRGALLFSGILDPAQGGGSYTLTRDICFKSGGAAMHFVIGSKGSGRGGWRPIDPDGGYDPDTATLIAS